MTRRGQPPEGLPGPWRGRPALGSDPGHHHGALEEQWPPRLFHPGEPRMGESGLTKQCRERTEMRGNLSRAAPTASRDSQQPRTPEKGCHPPTRSCPSILGHRDCNDHVLLLHGPGWHRNPRGNAPVAEGDCARGVMPHHRASLHPPSELCPKNSQRWEKNRCRFRDTVIKELQVHSKNFTGVLQSGTGPRGHLPTVNDITVLSRDL